MTQPDYPFAVSEKESCLTLIIILMTLDGDEDISAEDLESARSALECLGYEQRSAVLTLRGVIDKVGEAAIASRI